MLPVVCVLLLCHQALWLCTCYLGVGVLRMGGASLPPEGHVIQGSVSWLLPHSAIHLGLRLTPSLYGLGAFSV